MTVTQVLAPKPIVSRYPDIAASAEDWVDWYWVEFLPAWIAHARDEQGLGFFDVLDANAQPIDPNRRTILAQARLLFTFSHLALLSDNPAYRAAAQATRDAIPAFRKETGLYCRAVTRSGGVTGEPEDRLATSYDQTFVILGLSTWGKLHPEDDVSAELDSCWAAIEQNLIDPKTGLLLEHDGIVDPARADAPQRAQNPHMHLYEAALQAFEMTGAPVWLARAARMRAKGLAYFFDQDTGTLAEFIAPDLSWLAGRDGLRREVGHQCEWAWLLLREVELGGDPDVAAVAARLLAFADQHGFASSGPMQGAAFDAVSADASWREDSFLMWPQTEAIKTYAVHAQDPAQGARARALAQLIFQRYFHGYPGFANQMDPDAQPIWPDGLSRLHYHLVLGLTEGARAGLWRNPA